MSFAPIAPAVYHSRARAAFEPAVFATYQRTYDAAVIEYRRRVAETIELYHARVAAFWTNAGRPAEDPDCLELLNSVWAWFSSELRMIGADFDRVAPETYHRMGGL